MEKNEITERFLGKDAIRWGFISAFLLCFIYWTYLILASQMSIAFDARDYEFLGRLIYEKGWVEFFKRGPNRMPLYPLVISLSMKMADILPITYQAIQKIIQVPFLLITQIFLIFLLRKLKIRRLIQLMTILYVGFSPALVNSAMSLYSEIITYPFVLAILFLSFLSWRAVHNQRHDKVALLAFLTGLLFAVITFGKGVFQYVFLAYCGFYALVSIHSLPKRNKKVFVNAILYLLVGFIVYHSITIPFKLANKKFNGHYVMTNRAGGLLVGNAVKRANPIYLRSFLAHVASIPGERVCRRFFSEDECRYCGFWGANHCRQPFFRNHLQGMQTKYLAPMMVCLSIGKAFERPFQYLLFMGIEGLRVPFWESTKVGGVNYPPWLQRLFDCTLFKNGIRLLMAVLTICSLFYLMLFVYTNRRYLTDFDSQDSGRIQLCFFMMCMVAVYTGLYSLYSIVVRYILPVVPLYLLIIAFFLENKISTYDKTRIKE